MASNYDHTAWFYDTLSKLVYGKSIIRAQTEFLHLIPENSTVLIAGGGTGSLLEEIAKIRPAGLKIIYVEVSAKMMALSKKRNAGSNEVMFFNQPIEKTGHDIKVNVVITPFLFDNHEPRQTQMIFANIRQLLNGNGLWLNTDFQLTGKWWQSILLRSMLLFFKLFKAVNNDHITDMRPVFEDAGYKKVATKTFYSDFIRTDVWQKPLMYPSE